MALEDHSRLIRDAARRTLSPLGFRQKGRSRVWIADRRYWALVIEFQPSGFSKGSYLNICASWFWHSGSSLPLDYYQRAGQFIEFESAEQFKPEAEWLADLASAEARQLDQKFESLDAIARYLSMQAKDERAGKNPWTLYHAAITAGLTDDRQFSLECFNRLIGQKASADWQREIQAEAAMLTKLLPSPADFHAAIHKKVAKTRAQLKLPPLTS